MGCGLFGMEETKSSGQIIGASRGGKRTQAIDCRKLSTKVIEQIVENIQIIKEKVSEEEVKFISQVMRKHELFCAMGPEQAEEVAKMMKVATTAKGQYLFKQDDPAACFFIIGDGQVDIQISGAYRRTLKKGDCFGQMALLYFSKRTASVKNTSSNLKLYIIKSKPFKNLLKTLNEKATQITQKILQKIQIFSLLTTKQKYALVNSFKRKKFEDGRIIFKKGQTAGEFFIIESGKVKIQFEIQNKKDLILGELESFGESALGKEGYREGTVLAIGNVTCLMIEKQAMQRSLGDKINNVIHQNRKKWALKHSPAFSHLTNQQVELLALQFLKKQAKPQDIIIDEGSPANMIIICLQGRINSKGPGSLFNDEYLHVTSPVILENQIMMNSQGSFAELKFERVRELLQNFQKKSLKKSRTSLINNRTLSSTHLRQTSSLKQNRGMLSLKNFDYLTKLGEGQFGQVFLIKERKLGILFALKSVSKEAILAEGMQECLRSEREILSSINHPLVVGYYKAFHDKYRVYFLLEYINGIEMYYAIREINVMSKNITRFYFGSVLVSIEYLHSINIIYRDVKPENCMIDSDGRVFLIDLGTAKKLKSQNSFKTETIIGTPHYLAPEVMQGRGYSYEADYWSLGVLLFEFIAGKLPFGDNLDNPYEIYGEVMRNRVSFPKFVKDNEEKCLVMKLLQKNPQDRSADGGLTEMKKSPYFNGFNWEDLEQGRMMGPHIPKRFRGEKKSKYEDMNGYPLLEYLKDLTKKKEPLKIEDWVSDSLKL